MLYRSGIWLALHPWPVIAVWALVLVPAAFFAPRVSDRLLSGLGEAPTEARAAAHLLEDELGASPTGMAFTFYHPELSVEDDRYREALTGAIAPLEALADVVRVDSVYSTGNRALASPDGHTTYVNVLIGANPQEALEHFSELTGAVSSELLEVKATGGLAIFADVNKSSERDLRRAELFTFPLVLLALIFVFRSVLAATLPLLMGGIAVAITLAAIYLLAAGVDMSVFVLNVITFLGLGAAIDYSLVLVGRFREERSNYEVTESVGRAMSTAGRAIVFSGITSMLGLSGLLFFDYMMLRSLGIGGVIVIAVSLVVALTLLPALMGLMGSRLGQGASGIGGARGWGRLAGWVMAHPWTVLVVVGVSLVALGTPMLRVNLGSPWADILPSSAESRQGWNLVADEIGPGELAPILVVLRSESGQFRGSDIPKIAEFAKRIEADPSVARIDSVIDLLPGGALEQEGALEGGDDLPTLAATLGFEKEFREQAGRYTSGSITLITVYSKFGPPEQETEDLVHRLRNLPEPEGVEILVGGGTADLSDAVDRMYGVFPWVIVYVMVSVYLALMVMFRSVLLPLKAVVMNTMSLFAAYGALVLIFQDGLLDPILGPTATGFTEATVPILIFAIVFGLSVDYEVFLLSRIKEHWDETGDNELAVRKGMEQTGRIVTSAALILVLVAGSFATADIVIVKALGLGTAIAIALDASIVRALFVPAIMRLMGPANWWAPGFIRRLSVPGLRT
ncbi:MAG: MMPL family transporter [Chloroflexi bacterium]|nr:MMPL family transporter [Chloroflexota bacterium]